ncbi:MAG TPA: response regulator [Nitrospiraceae bacterium]|nr:response regulator [Nitrospiraceae bacterium]
MLGDCRAAAMKQTRDSQKIPSPVVLVVDDEPLMRLLAREALERVGLAVVEAEDGMQAVEAYRRSRPALVLLDLLMPEMDGFSVCAELRRLPAEERTPILIMTGLDDETSIRRAYQVGATDFITKPISRMVLGQRALYMLRAGRTVRDLIESQARVQAQAALLDIAQDAMIVSDLEGRLTFWNAGAERLYGWMAHEVLGQQMFDHVGAGIAPSLPELRTRVLADGHWRGEVSHKTKEGHPVIVDSRWTLVRRRDGAPQSILMVNSDMTEKKQLERQCLRAQRLESLGTLASGIAHDMNNVLTPIMLAAKLLRAQETDPTNRKHLETIESSARRGAEMTQKVLLFARGADVQRQPVEIAPMLIELGSLLRETLTPSIELTTECPDEIWPVMGDPTQLYQILMNLCVNARDAMPGGGRLKIEARNAMLTLADLAGHDAAQPGPYVCLSVTDSGSGISPDVLDKIFDPFFTTKDVGKGTGLGLSTVMGVAKTHGGFVTVSSALQKGTEFQVYLSALAESRTERKAFAPAGDLRGRGELVLVVDDEEAVLRMTRAVLDASGYRVLTAGNGAEAVDLCARHPEPIDLVVMDLVMPVMDGSSAIRALRDRQVTAKIIAVSGISASAGQEEGRHTAFLQKPYSPQILLTTLQKELHHSLCPIPVDH